MHKFLLIALAVCVVVLASPLQNEPAQALIMPPPPARVAVQKPTLLGMDEDTVVVLGAAAAVTGGAALLYVAAAWGTVAAATTFAIAVDYVSNAAFVVAVGNYGYERLSSSPSAAP